MKYILLLLTLLALATTPTQAQDDNPYARFGHKGKVLKTPQERQQFMLKIPNPDATSEIALVGIAPNEGKYYLFDAANEVIQEDTLMNDELSRFLSVDPLTRSYPWYTPYQFAGNKPIWAVDLDGLEELYATDGSFKGYGEDKNSNEIRVFSDEETYQVLSLHGLLKLQKQNKLGYEAMTKTIIRNQRVNKIYSGDVDLSQGAPGNQGADVFRREGTDFNIEYVVDVLDLYKSIDSEDSERLNSFILNAGHEYLHIAQRTTPNVPYNMDKYAGGKIAREILAHHFVLFPNSSKSTLFTGFEAGVTHNFNELDKTRKAFYVHQAFTYINRSSPALQEQLKNYISEISNLKSELEKEGFKFPENTGDVRTDSNNFKKANGMVKSDK